MPRAKRTVDTEGWEKAIQQVTRRVQGVQRPCGCPATANDIEMRMKQGFSVFYMNWGDQGSRPSTRTRGRREISLKFER